MLTLSAGTSSIVDEKTHRPLIANLGLIAETCTRLHDQGHRVLLVSSGAIGIALWQMGLNRRPKHLPQVQALASIGQCHLMRTWDEVFAHLKQPVAQILLTRNDIADRTQYLNAQNTLRELFEMGVIPIVNENDTVSVSEIKFGDNDTLSAIAAGMVQADYLFLMTDVDCLYDKNPRKFAEAKPIEVVEDIDQLEADVSSAGSAVGTGGMGTKIVAARLATAAGVTTVITRSSEPGNVAKIVKYVESLKVAASTDGLPPPAPVPPATLVREDSSADVKSLASSTSSLALESQPPPLHTRFTPNLHPIRDRSFWILHGLAPHGTIYIDEGARTALMGRAGLRKGGRAGLLPAGIVDVEGTFAQQEAVRICVVKRLPGITTPSLPLDEPTTPRIPATPPRLHARTQSYGLASYEAASGDPNGNSSPASGSDAAGNASSSSPPRDPAATYDRTVPPVEVARAIVNYSSGEIRRIKGLRSTEIALVLGYADSEYVALRENIAVVKPERSGSRPETPAPV